MFEESNEAAEEEEEAPLASMESAGSEYPSIMSTTAANEFVPQPLMEEEEKIIEKEEGDD
jgi:hypothetical protein